MDGVVRKAAELKISSDLGPVIKGYVDTDFKNVQPNSEVEEVRDRELKQDLEGKAIEIFEYNCLYTIFF